MKKAIGYVSVLSALFVFILISAGLFPFPINKIFSYLAYVLPFFFILSISDKDREVKKTPLGLHLTKEDLLLTLPLLFPTVLLVFGVSALTSLLLSNFGEAPVTDVSGNIFLMILLHAILPAIFEEALFRYIPIRLVRGYSNRLAVLVSAIFFATAHLNLWQFPYAFLAGIIFAALDVALNSIWPSVLLHALNNVISIVWLRYATVEGFAPIFFALLALLAALSLVPVLIYRKKYAEMASFAFENKNKEKLPLFTLLVPLACTVSALISFFR